MKFRDGFVSNSSSSSFVIVGVRATGKLRQLVEEMDESGDVPSLCSLGFGWAEYNDHLYVGVKKSWSDEDYAICEISADDIKRAKDGLKKLTGKDVKVSVFAGSEMC